MKKGLVFTATLLLAARAIAQSGYTQTTATMPNNCYGNGSVVASWVNGSTAPVLPNLNGSTFPQQNNGAISAQGVFTLKLADNSMVLPQPNSWTITACQKGGSQPACYTASVTVSSNSQDVSSAFAGAPSCSTNQGSFQTITSGTNNQATMVVGPGASIAPSGSGVVNANRMNGAALPTSATGLATNSLGQIIPGTGGGLAAVTGTSPISVTTAGGTANVSFTASLQTIGGYLVYTAGVPFSMSISCSAAGNFEVGYASVNPNICTLGYSNGTASSASVNDGTNTYTQTTPYTTYTGSYSYSTSKTFNANATATNAQTASASTGFNVYPCTFSGTSSNASPTSATASGSGAGNQCASETVTLGGGGTLSSNGLGSTYVGQTFTFSSPGGKYIQLFLTETSSGCNRNPFTFNGSSPVNGSTLVISSYTNILSGAQPNMCIYTFGPYSSAVTLEVNH